jgi:hypothetical protein
MSLFECRYKCVSKCKSIKVKLLVRQQPDSASLGSHNSSIRSAIEVNEHLMESLFDNISNRSVPTSISNWQGLEIIVIFHRYFLSGATALSRACYSHLGLRPKLEHAPRRWRTPKRCPRMPSSLAITLGVKQGRPSQVEGQSISTSSPSRAPGPVYSKMDA